jgi:hypothetical protein
MVPSLHSAIAPAGCGELAAQVPTVWLAHVAAVEPPLDEPPLVLLPPEVPPELPLLRADLVTVTVGAGLAFLVTVTAGSGLAVTVAVAVTLTVGFTSAATGVLSSPVPMPAPTPRSRTAPAHTRFLLYSGRRSAGLGAGWFPYGFNLIPPWDVWI